MASIADEGARDRLGALLDPPDEFDNELADRWIQFAADLKVDGMYAVLQQEHAKAFHDAIVQVVCDGLCEGVFALRGMLTSFFDSPVVLAVIGPALPIWLAL